MYYKQICLTGRKNSVGVGYFSVTTFFSALMMYKIQEQNALYSGSEIQKWLHLNKKKEKRKRKLFCEVLKRLQMTLAFVVGRWKALHTGVIWCGAVSVIYLLICADKTWSNEKSIFCDEKRNKTKTVQSKYVLFYFISFKSVMHHTRT